MNELQAHTRLFVTEATNTDNSVVQLHSSNLVYLRVSQGDLVRLKGKRETLCIVLQDDTVDVNGIRMNKVVRNNVGAEVGEFVGVFECKSEQVQFGKKIRFEPFEDTLEPGMTGDKLFNLLLKPYLINAYRPMCLGTIVVGADIKSMLLSPLLTNS
jgi:transitional endoplasmic reticulum ATPase